MVTRSACNVEDAMEQIKTHGSLGMFEEGPWRIILS